MRIHLDTDFGGDPDDACALAMLLGWPGVDLVGITTTIDPGGQRAAYVMHLLELAGRSDIPVAPGAASSLTTRKIAEPFVEERYWPAIPPLRSPPGAALDLLHRNVKDGAAVIAIGPYTNLALLEIARPGTLVRTSVTVMGGWVHPPDAGFPQWGPEMDFNVQWDTRAAEIVAATAGPDLTLSPMAASLHAPLRVADLHRLRASGPLGELLARQSEAYAADAGMAELGRSHDSLPADLLNLHWDPVACAVALGWPGAVVEELRLRPVLERDALRFEPDPLGRLTRVVTRVDGERFRETLLSAVEAADRRF